MRSASFAVASLCAVFVVGCNLMGGGEVPASEYDQSCETDSECTTVYAGDICDCGSLAAISKDALDKFTADKAKAAAVCGRRQVCTNEWKPDAVCVDHTCTLETSADAGQSSGDG